MRTPAQQAASRANGARSRGPKTPEGKLRSTAKPFLHDLLAKATVLKNESREGFQELVRQHMLRIAPRDAVEQAAVEEICSATWRLYRLRAIERKAIDLELAAQSSPDDLECLLHACGALAGKESPLPPPPPASRNPPPEHHPARPRPHRGPASHRATKKFGKIALVEPPSGRASYCAGALIHAPPDTHPRPPGCSLRHPRKNPGRTQEEPRKNPRRTREEPTRTQGSGTARLRRRQKPGTLRAGLGHVASPVARPSGRGRKGRPPSATRSKSPPSRPCR